ncbi:PAS domain S-box-containing protein [Halomicrobium zhouii]|uniref:histidine kinase n=1 Tax=Halomicrobium zhouii TaxID=767519 RepID=A0A1I6LY13_9EURY|nr:HAMP domain-containing sensor histidine kinase [Halomicrobium zhouii]SFS08361.1 PAS domain S-box-containing protein [Halomicrobium zhouii]
MNVILQQPSSVLVVSENVETVATVRTALADASDTTVRHEPDPGDALDTFVDLDEIGCVVLDESVPDVASFRTELAERDDLLPVVYLAPEADRALLSRLSRFESTTYLPRPVAESVLRKVLEESRERYYRKRVTAEESDMLRAFTSELEIPVFVKDEAGRHLRMTDVPGGADQDAIVGKTDREVYSYDPEAAAEFYADDMRVVEQGVSIHQQDEASGPPGNRHWTRVSKVPWPADDGSNKGLIGVAMDVTDLKEMERRAEQLRERLEQFASYISHDLQNPLNLASGHLEMAREDGDEDALDTAAAALDRVDEMLTDLDHLARQPPRAGGGEYVEVPFVARQLWSFVATEDAELVVEMPEPTRIRAPARELRPLLENLLRNAVEHSSTSPPSHAREDAAGRQPSGEPAVADAPADAVEHSSTSPPSHAREDAAGRQPSGEPSVADAPEDAVEHGSADVTVRVGALDDGFYVGDDGPGIPPSERETVLQRGYTTAEDGSGTGLALVAEVAERNGWSIRITESADGGARFEFRDALVVTEPESAHQTGPSIRLTEESAVPGGDVAGSADYDPSSDTWTVRCDTAGETGPRSCYVAHAVTDGSVRIQARLRTVDHVHDRSSAGLWMGDGLGETDAFGSIGRTVGGQTELVYRPEPGGDLARTVLVENEPHEWFRLERTGETLTCSVSVDGTDWVALDQRRVALADPVRPSLAVSSAVPGDPCEATFSTVRTYELE